MDGIDAFTPPPMGDVGYAQGREILGPGFSIRAGLSGGLPGLEKSEIRKHVSGRRKTMVRW